MKKKWTTINAKTTFNCFSFERMRYEIRNENDAIEVETSLRLVKEVHLRTVHCLRFTGINGKRMKNNILDVK